MSRRRAAAAAERPLAVDLYAGTGGATAAFRDAGWDVLSIDIERRPREAVAGNRDHRVVADVRALPLRRDVERPVTLLWASVPCIVGIAATRRTSRARRAAVVNATSRFGAR